MAPEGRRGEGWAGAAAACYADTGSAMSHTSSSNPPGRAPPISTKAIVLAVLAAAVLVLIWRRSPARRAFASCARTAPLVAIVAAVGGHLRISLRRSAAAAQLLDAGEAPPRAYTLSAWGPIRTEWPPPLARGVQAWRACTPSMPTPPARIAFDALESARGGSALRASLADVGYAIVTGLAAPPHDTFGVFFARPAAAKRRLARRLYDGRCRCVGYCEQGAFRTYVEVRELEMARGGGEGGGVLPASGGAPLPAEFAAAGPALRESAALARAALRVLAPAAVKLVDARASLWRVHNYSRAAGVRQRAHADLGFITVARAGSTPGLEVATSILQRDRNGGRVSGMSARGWHPLDAALGPHDAVVFGGKQLALVSGGRFRPLLHRVNLGKAAAAHPLKQHRLSSLFFLRARPDALLTSLREDDDDDAADVCAKSAEWDAELDAGVAAQSLEFRE